MEIKGNFSRAETQKLLTDFLIGTQRLDLTRILADLRALPIEYRVYAQTAEAIGAAWVAWSTPSVPVLAWGTVDVQRSRRLDALLLHVNWYDTLSGHHSLWSYCDPKRTTEWTVGTGRYDR